jgi:hypothetical protein
LLSINYFWNCQKLWKNKPTWHPQNLKETLSKVTPSFSMVHDCKISLFLLLKANDKKILSLGTLVVEPT